MENIHDCEWDGSIGFIRRVVPESDDENSVEDLEHAEGTKASLKMNSEQASDSETDLECEEDVEFQCKEIEGSRQHLEKVYKKACKKLKITPCSPFLRSICNEEIDLSHYNIGPSGAKAIAKALRENTVTFLLNVHDNGIGADGAKALADMLIENCFITVLDVSMNFIKEEGFNAMRNMMIRNKFILEMSFASTKLSNAGSAYLGLAIKENTTISSLDLSSNEIGDEGSIQLADGIKENKSILFLSLSCNHIRGKGASAIANALLTNNVMKSIDLSGNGFADYGSRAIGSALKVNSTLRDIDMSQNRITQDGAWALGIGLEENVGLRVLKIGGNPFQSRGAASIIDCIITNKESTIEEIHFDDVVVSSDFQKLVVELLEQRRDLHVQFGVIVKGKDHKKRGKEQKDLVSRILDHIELRGIRIVDFFRAMDKTSRLKITKEEFIKGLKTARIPMRRSQVDNLFDLLDVDDDGFAHYKEFVEVIKRRTQAEFAATRNNYQWNH